MILVVLLECIFGNEIGLFGLGSSNNGHLVKSLGKKVWLAQKKYSCVGWPKNSCEPN